MIASQLIEAVTAVIVAATTATAATAATAAAIVEVRAQQNRSHPPQRRPHHTIEIIMTRTIAMIGTRIGTPIHAIV